MIIETTTNGHSAKSHLCKSAQLTSGNTSPQRKRGFYSSIAPDQRARIVTPAMLTAPKMPIPNAVDAMTAANNSAVFNWSDV